MSVDALCIGHASYDLCMVLDSFPAENSKTETDLLLESGGGPAANAAWLLARWGVATALASLVGDDEYGRRVVRELQNAGVDCRLVQQLPDHQTPVSFIVVNRSIASRTIINRKTPSATLDLKPESFAELEPKLLLFDGHELKAALAAMDTFPSAITLLDAGSLREGTRVLAERVQYLVCSERFAVQATGQKDVITDSHKTLRQLRQFDRQAVVMTLGEHGSVFADGSGSGHVAALAGPACDTTAAGDIFHGAFAFALLQGMGLREALELAAIAAGLSVRRFGGRTSAPDLPAVRKFLSHER